MDRFARMAEEYRRSAAVISLRIEEMGAPVEIEQRRRKAHLISVLAELRTTAALLETYYEVPRDHPCAAGSYYAPKRKHHDDG